MAKRKQNELPELNEGLIDKVLKHIKDDLRRYEQDIIGVRPTTPELVESVAHLLDNQKFPDCGTKACFGGWGLLLSTPQNEWGKLFDDDGEMGYRVLTKATTLFGFTEYEAGYVFDAAGRGTPSKNYQVIKQRIKTLRDARAKAKQFLELQSQREQMERELNKVTGEMNAIANDNGVYDMAYKFIDQYRLTFLTE